MLGARVTLGLSYCTTWCPTQPSASYLLTMCNKDARVLSRFHVEKSQIIAKLSAFLFSDLFKLFLWIAEITSSDQSRPSSKSNLHEGNNPAKIRFETFEFEPQIQCTVWPEFMRRAAITFERIAHCNAHCAPLIVPLLVGCRANLLASRFTSLIAILICS